MCRAFAKGEKSIVTEKSTRSCDSRTRSLERQEHQDGAQDDLGRLFAIRGDKGYVDRQDCTDGVCGRLVQPSELRLDSRGRDTRFINQFG